MSKNWKETLLMPNTDFLMKADLKNSEPKFREFWAKNSIVDKVLEQNKDNQKFILHDGPPYANGDLHVGHALNKILKDVIIRRKNMEQKYSPWFFGWDTHGLPIENKMLEKLSKTKDDFDPIQLIKEAKKYAISQVELQSGQFEKMNLFVDFNKKSEEWRYVTLDNEYEAHQLELLKKMSLDKLVYKGLKPVFWSTSSESSLAEAEVEYKEHVSPQVIVSFRIANGNEVIGSDAQLLIMTTTPWTLIANSGVAVGEDFDYALVQAGEEKYVIAVKLIENIATLSKWENYNILKQFKGQELVGIEYIRPIKRDKTAFVILGHHVSTDAGTGLVHMAPMFGEDDYIVGLKNDLEQIMHVDSKGYFNESAGEYNGKFYVDANKDIGLFLDSKKELLSLKFIKHSYPHDWRTKKPIIYRGVPQWFINIKPIKEKILNSLDGIHTHPTWGRDRMKEMISNRDVWTISRQRSWGVPLIFFYDKSGQPIIEEEIFDYVIALVKEHGSVIWWEWEADKLLPPNFRGKDFTKEMDIMDVWFDSGSSSIAVSNQNPDTPFDMYFEGSDQYRGWFNSSLINSVAFRDKAPFRELLSHGFVLDGKGNKMSKSIGNVITPMEVIEKNGVEILRLWAANSEYTSDISISQDIIKQNIEIYRRIRNTIKFMLGNLFDFTDNDKVELQGFHLFVDEKLQNLIYNVNKLYSQYKFINIIKEVNQFLIYISSNYFDHHKDTLYVREANDLERRMVQTNIFNILIFLIKTIAPILPTTAEEAYSHFSFSNKKESIFLEYITEKGHDEKQKQELWKPFFDLKDRVYKLIEELKKQGTVKRSNELKITVDVREPLFKDVNLSQMLMVAYVEFGDNLSANSFDSVKCQRCWNHFIIEEIKDGICVTCNKVVN